MEPTMKRCIKQNEEGWVGRLASANNCIQSIDFEGLDRKDESNKRKTIKLHLESY